jgi:Family of unknown function (DUF6328)
MEGSPSARAGAPPGAGGTPDPDGTDAAREAADAAQAEPDRPGETLAERADRNVMELLNELRVVGIGIQVMFGFLLSIPFANRFVKLDHTERAIYLVTVVLAALSTALLVTPVAYHRLLFRRHEKETLVRVTNRLAIAGLVTVGLAVCSAVLLVTSFVAPGLRAVVITAGLACVFAGLWFALPLARLSRDDIDDHDDRAPGR